MTNPIRGLDLPDVDFGVWGGGKEKEKVRRNMRYFSFQDDGYVVVPSTTNTTTHDTRPVRFEVFIVFIPCVSGIIVVLLLLSLVFLFLFLIDWFSFTHNHSTHLLTTHLLSFSKVRVGGEKRDLLLFFSFSFSFSFPVGI